MPTTLTTRRRSLAPLPDRSPDDTPGASVKLQSIRHGFIHGDRVVRALWDLDLEAAPGEFVGLVGPSGCGKTTVLSFVAGMVSPREGSVLINGHPPQSRSGETAYMLARDALLPWKTARQNVELGLKVRGADRRLRRKVADEWLEKVGLGDFKEAAIRQLSQGMRQRVAIARTLALRPLCILMDEPFAALDAQTRALVQAEFLDLWERQRPTVIFVTHDLDEAILLSDRVVLMSHRPGRVVCDTHIDIPRPRTAVRETMADRFLGYRRNLSTLLAEEVRAAAP